MEFETNAYTSLPPRRRWWSQPIVTMPASHDRKATFKERAVCLTPCCGGIFTIIALMVYFFLLDNAQCDAKFSIQSIAVSPSSDTWHVEFLVKNPSSRYSIYYGGDETAVSLGALNAAVINTFYARKSPRHTAFSVDFVAEGNPNDVVSEDLDIKLRAKHLSYYRAYSDIAGHIHIRCHNLTRIHDNVKNIQYCYIELFADSVSVSNANVSTADLRVGFVARSPVSGCKISIHALNSRLLRGIDVISNSSSTPSSSDYLSKGDKTHVVFEKVVLSEAINGRGVIWNIRVDEVMLATYIGSQDFIDFLVAACPAIPVKFTTDLTGKVKGSLLGNVRRCDYKLA
ncbi:hypothetical protein CARUB_v10003603mg [Capsella rubella]|uniref:Uncharacterized protein n=1 Tax=Capsella rubella TaxID=81985 RepID=R0FK78_9BRAS|nr:hypothetical protein CARUB_v10003603mg [Capsella rubella]